MACDSIPVTTYQFQIDEEVWAGWKNTVPRAKSLDERLIELIRADTEGRVQDRAKERISDADSESPNGYTRVGNVSNPSSGDEPQAARQKAAENINADDPREILGSLYLSGSGENYKQRVDSVVEIYRFLQSNPGKRLSKSDFQERLDGTDVGYAGGFSALWSNWVKSDLARQDGQDVLSSLPNVELRGTNYIYQSE